MITSLKNRAVVGSSAISVLAFYSNDPSLNPAEPCSIFCKNVVFEKGLRQIRKRPVLTHSKTNFKNTPDYFYELNLNPGCFH